MAMTKGMRVVLALGVCVLLGAASVAEEPAPAPNAQAETTAEQPAGEAAETPAAEQPAQEPSAGEEAKPAEGAPAAAGQPAEAPGAAEEAKPAEEVKPAEETPAAAEQPAEPTGPTIVAIEVAGNERIAAETILEACPLKVGEVYTDERRDAAAQAIRDLGWFFSVTLSTRPEGDGVRLVINVVENTVVQGVSFEGNTVFSSETLAGLLETKPGTVLNNNTIRRDVAAIQDKYHQAGYAYARVMALDIDEATSTLIIPIVEGVIEAIRVEGNTKTRSYVITRELYTRVGQVLNTRRVQRDLERLMNLDLFQDVSAIPEVGTKVGQLILVIRIREKKTGLASVGLGYSSVQNLVGFVDVTEANLKGTAQLVNVRAEFGGRSSYELGYYNPWIRSDRTSLRVGLYNKLILREAFTQDESFLYDERRSGGNVTLSRPLSDVTRIFASVRVDDVSARRTDQDESVSEEVALLQTSRVRSVGLTLVNDTRDLIANPTRGAMYSLSAEQAGLFGGGARFGKFGSDFRRYFRVGTPDRIVATRLLMGITTGSPPFLEQFLVGGGETLRGYRNDRFPGRNMALLNLEYRFLLSKKSRLLGVVFTDVGDAWGGAFSELFGDANFKAHVGYGVGIRVVTPIGPLRLDYGIGSEGAETHFSVGHVF